jgi:hypothetical protein
MAMTPVMGEGVEEGSRFRIFGRSLSLLVARSTEALRADTAEALIDQALAPGSRRIWPVAAASQGLSLSRSG